MIDYRGLKPELNTRGTNREEEKQTGSIDRLFQVSKH